MWDHSQLMSVSGCRSGEGVPDSSALISSGSLLSQPEMCIPEEGALPGEHTAMQLPPPLLAPIRKAVLAGSGSNELAATPAVSNKLVNVPAVSNKVKILMNLTEHHSHLRPPQVQKNGMKRSWEDDGNALHVHVLSVANLMALGTLSGIWNVNCDTGVVQAKIGRAASVNSPYGLIPPSPPPPPPLPTFGSFSRLSSIGSAGRLGSGGSRASSGGEEGRVRGGIPRAVSVPSALMGLIPQTPSPESPVSLTASFYSSRDSSRPPRLDSIRSTTLPRHVSPTLPYAHGVWRCG